MTKNEFIKTSDLYSSENENSFSGFGFNLLSFLSYPSFHKYAYSSFINAAKAIEVESGLT
jgi:hypothetical protein